MRVITGICVVLALAASGCTQAAEPTTLPEPSVSASASPPPSTDRPWPTSTPTTPATAEAVAGDMEAYLLAAISASAGSGLEDFRNRFLDSCQICMTQYRNFSSAQEQGYTVEGDLYESWDIRVEEVDSEQAVVITQVDTGEITLRDELGEALESFPGETGIVTAWTLVRDPVRGMWLVVADQDLP